MPLTTGFPNRPQFGEKRRPNQIEILADDQEYGRDIILSATIRMPGPPPRSLNFPLKVDNINRFRGVSKRNCAPSS